MTKEELKKLEEDALNYLKESGELKEFKNFKGDIRVTSNTQISDSVAKRVILTTSTRYLVKFYFFTT